MVESVGDKPNTERNTIPKLSFSIEEKQPLRGQISATREKPGRIVRLVQSVNELSTCQKICLTLATTFTAGAFLGAGVLLGTFLINRTTTPALREFSGINIPQATVTSYEEKYWLDDNGMPVTESNLFTTPQSTSSVTPPRTQRGEDRSTRRAERTPPRTQRGEDRSTRRAERTTPRAQSGEDRSTRRATEQQPDTTTTIVSPGYRPSWISLEDTTQANKINNMKALRVAAGQACQKQNWSKCAALLYRQAEVCGARGGSKTLCQGYIARANNLQSKII